MATRREDQEGATNTGFPGHHSSLDLVFLLSLLSWFFLSPPLLRGLGVPQRFPLCGLVFVTNSLGHPFSHHLNAISVPPAPRCVSPALTSCQTPDLVTGCLRDTSICSFHKHVRLPVTKLTPPTISPLACVATPWFFYRWCRNS